MLIDSHCHLDFPELAADRAGLIARAAAQGVTGMVTISTFVSKAGVYREIAETHPEVMFTIGTHPHNAAAEPDVSAAELVAVSRHPRCVAIGEAGLDYHYERSPREVQQRVFRTHIAAARESELPLVIHARDADEDMMRILTEESGRGRFDAVLHCFSSGSALAELGVELGFYVSFSGILTFKASDALRRLAVDLPRDRLLVETDAPYLAPVPHRGRTNEPAYVRETASVLADTLGLTLADTARITTDNALRLFPKASAAGFAASAVAAA
jgi:TatD DNase family protein